MQQLAVFENSMMQVGFTSTLRCQLATDHVPSCSSWRRLQTACRWVHWQAQVPVAH
jgi:hypothetical protein